MDISARKHKGNVGQKEKESCCSGSVWNEHGRENVNE